MKKSEINNAEKRIKDYIKNDLKLYVKQVKVHPAGLKEPPNPAIAPPKPPKDIYHSFSG